MKALKTLLLAGLLASGCFSVASAQTKVYITGSTAFRGSTLTSIQNILSSGYTYAYTGTTFSKAGSSIFAGNLKSTGASVIIKATFTGSAGGVQAVAGKVGVKFIIDGQGRSTTGTQNAPDPTASGNSFDTQTPQITMSDSFQSATLFNGTNSVTGSPVTYAHLNDNIVGVVPFKFVASNGAPAGLSNITDNQAVQLFTAGGVPLSFFTGSHADESTFVFATGRDADSGTRIAMLVDTGIGVNTPLAQFQPTISGGAVVSQILYPAKTINGVSYDEGNGGEASGGTLAGFINKPSFAGIGGYYITYLSVSDAATALSGPTPGKELSYNGVFYGTAGVGPQASATLALAEGNYGFWGNEHLDYDSSFIGTGAAKQAALDMIANISNVTAPVSGVFLGDINVSRDSDGGAIFFNPTY